MFALTQFKLSSSLQWLDGLRKHGVNKVLVWLNCNQEDNCTGTEQQSNWKTLIFTCGNHTHTNTCTEHHGDLWLRWQPETHLCVLHVHIYNEGTEQDLHGVNECKGTHTCRWCRQGRPPSFCPHMAAIDQYGGWINGSRPTGGIIIWPTSLCSLK